MEETNSVTGHYENLQYLVDALQIIEGNYKGFHEGQYPNYRVIAGQLRMLLCDKNQGKENSLALKVFPDLTLHPLRKKLPDTHQLLFWMSASITGIPNAARFVDVFDCNATPIPLNEWRNQVGVFLDGKTYTLGQMIKSVAEKDGGSHVDDKPDDYLVSARKMYHKGDDLRATAHHEPMMIAIGEYVVEELRRRLNELDEKMNS
jgi:hypothetical protein